MNSGRYYETEGRFHLLVDSEGIARLSEIPPGAHPGLAIPAPRSLDMTIEDVAELAQAFMRAANDAAPQADDGAIYVVVAENDQPVTGASGIFQEQGGPIVLETYARGASLQRAQTRRDQLAGRYGRCRIAKLVFVDDEGR